MINKQTEKKFYYTAQDSSEVHTYDELQAWWKSADEDEREGCETLNEYIDHKSMICEECE
jgi:cephalosporin-C deacetylase-like acetyl esterase